MPAGDRTPEDWSMPQESVKEKWLKKPLRRLAYPPYLKLISPFMEKRFDPEGVLDANQWYWGNRGLEYAALRRVVDGVCRIQGKSILIAGCGTGRDIPSWLPFLPAGILGVDYFDYSRSWNAVKAECRGKTSISFLQGNLENLFQIADNSIDIVASDAVLEHLRNFPAVLSEFSRIIRPGGVMYATFGPLWHAWGGDHFSGHDSLSAGYNHLLLEKEAYQSYLNGGGEFSHSEHDGRTWIENELFSYLRPLEYLQILDQSGLSRKHVGVVIEPNALKYQEDYPEQAALLLQRHSLLDLIVTGMTVIYEKPLK